MSTIIIDESHFVDDESGRTIVRYIPRLGTSPCFSGAITFACFDVFKDDPPSAHLLAKDRSIDNAARVLCNLADSALEQCSPLSQQEPT
jgi:hypothetical protein